MILSLRMPGFAGWYGTLKWKIMQLAHNYGLIGRFVRFTEALSRDEVDGVLGRASLFVFPSLREGLPLSTLEAMACGVPVIGSDVPGVNDVIVNCVNGLLVPAKNSKALAEAILTLLNDTELRKRLGQNARKLIIEKYNWDIVIEKMERVYYEVINGIKHKHGKSIGSLKCVYLGS